MSYQQKAWTQHTSGRLKRQQQQATSNAPDQTKKDDKSSKSKEPPKSKALKDLQVILDGLRVDKSTKDPNGGCFCQARQHSLSPYTPICYSCGLVLCELNPPQHICPHCATSLLSSNPSTDARKTLITTLETQITDQLARESRERERAIEEARQRAGDFPSLSPSPAGSGSTTPNKGPGTRKMLPPPSGPHKVLSLDPRTKKVKVKTTPAPSKPSSISDLHSLAASDDNEPVVIRVPAPPSEDEYYGRWVGKWDKSRPWADVKKGGILYVPELTKGNKEEKSGGSRKEGRDKGKGKENATEAEGSAKPGAEFSQASTMNR